MGVKLSGEGSQKCLVNSPFESPVVLFSCKALYTAILMFNTAVAILAFCCVIMMDTHEKLAL